MLQNIPVDNVCFVFVCNNLPQIGSSFAIIDALVSLNVNEYNQLDQKWF